MCYLGLVPFRFLSQQLGRDAMERSARGDDVFSVQLVMARHDDEIEMLGTDHRILQLHRARASPR